MARTRDATGPESGAGLSARYDAASMVGKDSLASSDRGLSSWPLESGFVWLVDSLQVSYVMAPVVVAYELAVLELPGPVDSAHPQPVQSDYSGAR
jgi:hypothetical protein